MSVIIDPSWTPAWLILDGNRDPTGTCNHAGCTDVVFYLSLAVVRGYLDLVISIECLNAILLFLSCNMHMYIDDRIS